MKTTTTRQQKLRASCLKEIAGIGPFVEGSLCEFKREGRQSASWHLTYKIDNKTHTVYVPVDRVEEVRQWAKEYRRLKRLIRKVTKQSLAIVRRQAGRRRGGSRASSKRSRRSPAR